jgi:hypothetical protein
MIVANLLNSVDQQSAVQLDDIRVSVAKLVPGSIATDHNVFAHRCSLRESILGNGADRSRNYRVDFSQENRHSLTSGNSPYSLKSLNALILKEIEPFPTAVVPHRSDSANHKHRGRIWEDLKSKDGISPRKHKKATSPNGPSPFWLLLVAIG